jgi:hypothetical protein
MTPIFGITYGPPKVGKTLAMVRAFPEALFLAPKGALGCTSWLGIKAKAATAPNVDTLIGAVKKAGSRYPAIVIDDASIQFEQEYQRIKSKDRSWGGNAKFNEKIFELRDVCRDSPVHVFWTMHEAPPREVKAQEAKLGKIIPGTVLVPGWQLPEKLPAMVDFIGRVVYDDDFVGWPYVYQTGPDPDYITGDRLSITPDRFPLNIGEVLRAAGYDVPRAKGLEWMEAAVEAVAKILLDVIVQESDIKDALEPVIPGLLKRANQNQKHVRWVIADAHDRANLQRHSASILDNYLETLL